MEPTKPEGSMEEGQRKEAVRSKGKIEHTDTRVGEECQRFVRFKQELGAEKGTGEGKGRWGESTKTKDKENTL